MYRCQVYMCPFLLPLALWWLQSCRVVLLKTQCFSCSIQRMYSMMAPKLTSETPEHSDIHKNQIWMRPLAWILQHGYTFKWIRHLHLLQSGCSISAVIEYCIQHFCSGMHWFCLEKNAVVSHKHHWILHIKVRIGLCSMECIEPNIDSSWRVPYWDTVAQW